MNQLPVGCAAVLLGLSAAMTAATAQGSESTSQHGSKVAADATSQASMPEGRNVLVDADGIWFTSAGQRKLLAPGRLHASVTVLPMGEVLVWGGTDDSGRLLKTGLLIDPTGVARVASLGLLPRAGHTATVLTDGRVLFAGGRSENGMEDIAELWDPRSWHSSLATNAFAPARADATAELAADGHVVIHGGSDDAGRQIDGQIAFDSSSDNFIASARSGDDSPAAPQIAASIPAAGATNVLPSAWIALRFTVPMAMDSLTRDTVTLIGPEGPVAARVTPVDEGRLVFLIPASDLYTGSNYTVFVQGAHTKDRRALTFSAIGFTTATLSAAATERNDSSGQPEPLASASQNGETSNTPGEGVAGADSNPGEPLYLMAGVGATKTLPACINGGNRQGDRFFCRDKGEVTDGAWRPGEDNRHGYWRVGKLLPPLPGRALIDDLSFRTGSTVLYGQVLQLNDQPLANVTVSAGATVVQTDARGRFVLVDAPVGHQRLVVEGASANHGTVEYASAVIGVDIAKGQITAVPHLIFLPRIHAADKVTIPSPTTQDTIITHPELPGMELRLPAGTVIKDYKGHVVTEIAIVPTPIDRAPYPVPMNFPVYFLIQPGGAVAQALTPDAAKGAQLVYPNYEKSAPGTQYNFYTYDATTGWKVYGTSSVSNDGMKIAPHHGVVFHGPMAAGLALAGNPPPPSPNPPPCNCSGGGSGSGPYTPYQFGDAAHDGDPVDLRTGLFVYRHTDMSIIDMMPMNITRTYRPGDTVVRPFGIGTNFNYGVYLYLAPTDTNYDHPELVLADGSLIVFDRVDGSANGGQWQHTATPTEYYGAVLATSTNSGHQWIVTLKDGRELHFAGVAPNKLTLYRDRFGNTITFSYSGSELVQATAPGGRYIQFGYDTGNRITSATDNSGRSVAYSYNAAGYLDTVTYPDTTTEHYTYDPATHNMLTVVDQLGNTILTNHYDANNRVDQQTITDSPNAVYTFVYTTDGNNVVTAADVTDPSGAVRHVVFDAVGYPVSDTYGYGTSLAQTYTFVRGQNELITSKTDPRGRVTDTTFDPWGDVLTRTYLSGTPNAITYTYTYTWDFHDVATATDPLQHTTTYGYSGGCLTTATDALNHATTIACNSAGQPLTITDALNHTTTVNYIGYDVRSVTDPLNHTTTFTTDSLGRTIVAQDPLGRSSRVSYDARDLVQNSTDPLGQQTTYTYDNNSNLKTVTDPNTGKTQYGYDTRNRRTSRTDALNQAETWTYDGMGNVLTYKDRKLQQTTYHYDTINRPNLITYADGSTVTPTFDNGNRLTQVVDSVSGTIVRGYDELDHMTSEQTPQGTVSYVYDNAGRRTQLTAASQLPITYGYDDADRLQTITQGTESVGFTYDNANRRATLTLPNGVVTTYTYDNANEITGVTYKTSTNVQLAALTYGYDAAGQRTSQTGGFVADVLPTATTGTNVFDLNNRQTQWNGTTTVTYDTDGNDTGTKVSNKATSGYTWDVRNRLSSIQAISNGHSTTTATFAYDTFGRRTSKTIGTTTTNFLYDGQNPVQETQGTTISSILTGMGIDERFARSETAGRYYFLTDALGSTLALTDTAQTVKQTYGYEPYGEVSSTGSSNNPYQYTGRENDGTGLYYYRARYYSPTLKRFISEDPIGLAGGPNEYAYVGARPTGFIDPFGLSGATGSWGGGATGSWDGVLLCHRPADLPFPGNLFNHYWFQTGTYESGMGGACPVPGQGCADTYGSATQTKDHSGQALQPNSTCVPVPLDEQCVDKAIKPGQPTGPFIPPINSCQTFANGVISQCSAPPFVEGQ